MTVSLDNIEKFKVPLEGYISKWIFTDENDQLASEEHQDQIFPLTKEAANFLWEYDMKVGIQAQTSITRPLLHLTVNFQTSKQLKSIYTT